LAFNFSRQHHTPPFFGVNIITSVPPIKGEKHLPGNKNSVELEFFYYFFPDFYNIRGKYQDKGNVFEK